MTTLFEGLPSSLRIGPFDVRVEVLERLKDEDDWGGYLPHDLLIQISDAQPSGTHAADTLIHEIHHALYQIHGLRHGDDEERIVGIFSTGLTQVFRDNPKLMQWIQTACQ